MRAGTHADRLVIGRPVEDGHAERVENDIDRRLHRS
jgi:hypothetical protein